MSKGDKVFLVIVFMLTFLSLVFIKQIRGIEKERRKEIYDFEFKVKKIGDKLEMLLFKRTLPQ